MFQDISFSMVARVLTLVPYATWSKVLLSLARNVLLIAKDVINLESVSAAVLQITGSYLMCSKDACLFQDISTVGHKYALPVHLAAQLAHLSLFAKLALKEIS